MRHDAGFKNGMVKLRFKLEHSKDQLGLNFADLQHKVIHAGHLFKVTISTAAVEVEDLKTGKMDLEIRKARQSEQGVSPSLAKMLLTKKKRFENPIKLDSWHEVEVIVKGSQIAISFDGKKLGDFASAGIAHPTKRMLRLAVPREAVVDDLSIYSHD